MYPLTLELAAELEEELLVRFQVVVLLEFSLCLAQERAELRGFQALDQAQIRPSKVAYLEDFFLLLQIARPWRLQ